MKERDIWAELAQAFDGGLDDIRHKVVEEPMWGRAVTEGMQWPEQQASISPQEPQALEGEIIDPPNMGEYRTYNGGDYLERGTIVDGAWEKARESPATPLLEDRSKDQGNDIER